MASRLAIVLATLATLLFAAECCQALDYHIERAFDVPVGEGQGENWHLGDFVTYRADTGEVTYHVDAVGDYYTSWWPPDFASRSGILLDVPYSEQDPPAKWTFGRLSINTDVKIEGAVVPGSNSSGFQYDGYAIWPSSISDPSVLATWGPLGMPYSFRYGKILPPGLGEGFLRSDIYSFPMVNLVYVVPEPAGGTLIFVAIMSGCRRRCDRSGRGRNRAGAVRAVGEGTG